MGWGGFLDKVMSWFTPEKAKERLRNKIDSLEKRKKEIINGKATPKSSNELSNINDRLDELNRLSKNTT